MKNHQKVEEASRMRKKGKRNDRWIDLMSLLTFPWAFSAISGKWKQKHIFRPILSAIALMISFIKKRRQMSKHKNNKWLIYLNYYIIMKFNLDFCEGVTLHPTLDNSVRKMKSAQYNCTWTEQTLDQTKNSNKKYTNTGKVNTVNVATPLDNGELQTFPYLFPTMRNNIFMSLRGFVT